MRDSLAVMKRRTPHVVEYNNMHPDERHLCWMKSHGYDVDFALKTGMLVKVTCTRCGEEGHTSESCGAPHCSRCGEYGHDAMSCRVRRCSNCGGIGHYAKTCTKKGRDPT